MQGRGGGEGVWDDIDMSVIVGGGPIRGGESECPIEWYKVTKRVVGMGFRLGGGVRCLFSRGGGTEGGIRDGIEDTVSLYCKCTVVLEYFADGLIWGMG